MLIFESRYRSIFARAVSLNCEILESIKSRSFIRAERLEEKLWQHKKYREVVSGSRLQEHKGFKAS